MYTFRMEVGEEDLGGGEPRKIAPVDSDVLYAFTLEKLHDPRTLNTNGYKVDTSQMRVIGQESVLQLNSKITSWEACFFVCNQKNSYDVQYVVKTNTQEKRTFIGELEDFVLQAGRKSSLWTESGSNNMILIILLNTLK